jgi:hypothetical protein
LGFEEIKQGLRRNAASKPKGTMKKYFNISWQCIKKTQEMTV